MKAVKIAWNRHAHLAPATPFSAGLTPAEWEAVLDKVRSAPHRCVQLSDDVFVEVPAPTWKHGDLLVYLPRQGWLVRTNYRDDWYVDLGFFRHLEGDLYTWTDLWLDVIAPEPATSYRVLDVDEFAEHLKNGRMAPELAAYALENLHALLELLHRGQFPPPEVRAALGAMTAEGAE